MSSSSRSKLKEMVRQLPQSPGVYIMRDRSGAVLYVGKAKNIKRRVSQYFQRSPRRFIEQPKIAAMVKLVEVVDCQKTETEADALILEERLIKSWRPKYNTSLVDDKTFLYIELDLDRLFPVFLRVRGRQNARGPRFGPFFNSVQLRGLLRELYLKYGVLIEKITPQKVHSNVYALYDDARSEITVSDNQITVASYRQRMEKACLFLEGKSKESLAELENLMADASQRQDFEKAALYRNYIRLIEHAGKKQHKVLMPKEDHTKALSELKEILGLENCPKVIECFDISHVSGAFLVASMVQFVDGKPNKRAYRRYKIKSFSGNDDYRSMEEVVERRYQNLTVNNSQLPDLVVIDGGLGQVRAAQKSFLLLGIPQPELIGLTKKRETIVFPDERKPLNVSLNNPGLRLLQQARDEAHRFANAFNASLRSKKIKESIINDCPGVGPKRRDILLRHFKTLQGLKKASKEEIQNVPGIGISVGSVVYDFLKRYS